MLPRARRLLAPFVVIAAGYGCALSVDTEEFTKGSADAGGPQPDATPTTSSSSSSSSGEVGAEAGVDASSDAGNAQTSCRPGELVRPVNAFDLGTMSGVVCNPEAALVDDGKFAGLDRIVGDESIFDGEPVTGCIGFEFGQVVRLAAVRVHAKPIASACGSTPCSIGTTGCGTGHTISMFGGLSRDTLEKGDVVNNTDADDTYLAVFEGARDVAIIAICREAWGAERDDMAIDSVAGVCP